MAPRLRMKLAILTEATVTEKTLRERRTAERGAEGTARWKETRADIQLEEKKREWQGVVIQNVPEGMEGMAGKCEGEAV